MITTSHQAACPGVRADTRIKIIRTGTATSCPDLATCSGTRDSASSPAFRRSAICCDSWEQLNVIY